MTTQLTPGRPGMELFPRQFVLLYICATTVFSLGSGTLIFGLVHTIEVAATVVWLVVLISVLALMWAVPPPPKLTDQHLLAQGLAWLARFVTAAFSIGIGAYVAVGATDIWDRTQGTSTRYKAILDQIVGPIIGLALYLGLLLLAIWLPINLGRVERGRRTRAAVGAAHRTIAAIEAAMAPLPARGRRTTQRLVTWLLIASGTPLIAGFALLSAPIVVAMVLNYNP